MSNYKSFFNELLKRPFNLSDVISSTLVGSNLNSRFNSKSDIDLIVITKNLNKNNFTKIKKLIKSINLSNYKLEKYKIVINSTFGPLKFEKKDQIIIHLMIYDIKGHINHVLESPFTCFDWERSKKFLGVSLKEIFSVGNLTLNDFFNNRRGVKSYIADLKEGVVTYRKYIFENKNYHLIKKKKKINNLLYKCEYSYHIFNNLIINFYKFTSQENIKINNEFFKILFLDITENDFDLYNKFLLLKNIKIMRNTKLNKNLNFLDDTLKFINYFYKKITYFKKNSIKITYRRHAKTNFNKNIFLGQKINPGILVNTKNKKFNIPKNHYDICYSSQLKRSIQSSKLFINDQFIHKNKLLNEIDYGLAEGLTYKDIELSYPYIIKDWNKNIDVRFPNGENNTDLLIRLKKFNSLILSKHSKKENTKILVVTHNAFIRALIGNFFNIPIYKWHKIKINYLERIEALIIDKKIILNISRIKIFKIASL